MQKLFIVYECNMHRDYISFVIKLICTSKRQATSHYKKLSKTYNILTDNYYLNLGYYVPTLIPEGDNNILSEIILLNTTEDE